MGKALKPIVVLTMVAAVAATFPAGAEANHRNKVLCGNFSGQGPDPRLARKPARCNVTRYKGGIPATVERLRSMRWTRWNRRAKGQGLVNDRPVTVRLKRRRPCGRNGRYKVYSKMSIDGGAFRRILHCGD